MTFPLTRPSRAADALHIIENHSPATLRALARFLAVSVREQVRRGDGDAARLLARRAATYAIAAERKATPDTIECSNCDHRFSTTAPHCPNCGSFASTCGCYTTHTSYGRCLKHREKP